MKKLPIKESIHTFAWDNNRKKINEIIDHINNEQKPLLPQIAIDNESKLIYAKLASEDSNANDFYPVHSMKIIKDKILVTWCNQMSACLLPEEFLFRFVDLKQIPQQHIYQILKTEENGTV